MADDRSEDLREEMAAFQIDDQVQVTIGYEGEGYNGDYNPEDEDDAPLLRLRVYDHACEDPHVEGSRSYRTNSVCTGIAGDLLTRDQLKQFCKWVAHGLVPFDKWDHHIEGLSAFTTKRVVDVLNTWKDIEPAIKKSVPSSPRYEEIWP